MIDTLFDYKVSSNRLVGRCRLQINGNLVIATELPDNPGQSITNAAEELATQVCQQFEISPLSLMWIEHYIHEDSELEETYDLVLFTWDGDRFIDPRWHRLSSVKLSF